VAVAGPFWTIGVGEIETVVLVGVWEAGNKHAPLTPKATIARRLTFIAVYTILCQRVQRYGMYLAIPDELNTEDCLYLGTE
jgi:hypothetical protein